MSNVLVEKIIAAIEQGKVRGFDEIKEIDGERFFFNMHLKRKMVYIIPIFFISWKRK